MTNRFVAWKQANCEKYREMQRSWNETHPESRMYSRAKARAKRDGREFTLTISDIVIPAVCPILGLELVPNKGRVQRNSPSIDRIDNSKGYTPDNIRVISYAANAQKGNR